MGRFLVPFQFFKTDCHLQAIFNWNNNIKINLKKLEPSVMWKNKKNFLLIAVQSQENINLLTSS